MKAKTDEILNISETETEKVSADFPAFDPENPAEYLAHCPADENGHKIVPDSIMDKYYSVLPENVTNESRSRITAKTGTLSRLSNDERSKEIQRAGARATNAKLAERKTFRETIEYMLTLRAKPEDIETLGLEKTATIQDAITMAMLAQSAKGNVKAAQFIRDTAGEMPTIKQEVTADILTAEDRELLQKIRNRQQAERKTVHNPAEEPKQE
ncbi:MAG: hypothetical protein IKH75_14245 [Ruminococcus sp.]|nr:hypothetical protein [Ruminococcus sp.]